MASRACILARSLICSYKNLVGISVTCNEHEMMGPMSILEAEVAGAIHDPWNHFPSQVAQFLSYKRFVITLVGSTRKCFAGCTRCLSFRRDDVFVSSSSCRCCHISPSVTTNQCATPVVDVCGLFTADRKQKTLEEDAGHLVALVA